MRRSYRSPAPPLLNERTAERLYNARVARNERSVADAGTPREIFEEHQREEAFGRRLGRSGRLITDEHGVTYVNDENPTVLADYEDDRRRQQIRAEQERRRREMMREEMMFEEERGRFQQPYGPPRFENSAHGYGQHRRGFDGPQMHPTSFDRPGHPSFDRPGHPSFDRPGPPRFDHGFRDFGLPPQDRLRQPPMSRGFGPPYGNAPGGGYFGDQRRWGPPYGDPFDPYHGDDGF